MRLSNQISEEARCDAAALLSCLALEQSDECDLLLAELDEADTDYLIGMCVALAATAAGCLNVQADGDLTLRGDLLAASCAVLVRGS